MSIRLSQTAHAQQFLEEASGNLNDAGNPRTKALIYRILRDTVNIIEDLEVTPEEFWKAVNYLNELGKKVDDCAKGAAIATGTTFEKTSTAESYDNLKPNKTGLLVLEETYKELGLEIGDTEKVFGSSDAGNVSMICPAFHPLLQIVDASVALHTREFEKEVKSERAYQGIETGAKILSLQILKIFTDEEKFQSMKQDFLKN